MYYSNKSREDIHLDLIKTRISGYEKDEHINLKADHVGYPYEQPDLIGGHIPDITSSRDGVFYVTEAETGDSIDTPETLSQWKTFSGETDGKSSLFHVVIPKSCLSEAQKFADDNKIRVDFWFYNTNY